MAVVIREIEENGKMYRITEDAETGIFIQECLDKPLVIELPPTPDQVKIKELEDQLAQTNADLAAILEMILAT